MLRIHFLQLWFTLSDPAMEEAFFDTPLYREFAQLQELSRLPDESAILRFRHRLEKYKLAGPILATVNEVLVERGLVHTVRGTSANVNDVVEGNALLHGEEEVAFGDAGYRGVDKRGDADVKVQWRVAMRPVLRRKLDKARPVDALVHKVEYLKASVRAKVEHPAQVIKHQFGYVKARYQD